MFARGLFGSGPFSLKISIVDARQFKDFFARQQRIATLEVDRKNSFFHLLADHTMQKDQVRNVQMCTHAWYIYIHI